MFEKRRFRQDTIAMVYDFDGTLTPQPMQEYTVLPRLEVKPSEFWDNVKRETKRTRGDQMLTYMRLLLRAAEARQERLSRSDLCVLGRKVQYYRGVKGWFPRVGRYVKDRGQRVVKLKNYVISAGLKEIIEGTSIHKHFSRVFASEYFFDHNGVAKFPNILVNDTIKTQYIFRINKGKEDVLESINEHTPDEDRVIPFANMIYIGDGMTDVPGMAVTKKNGGYAVAVHTPGEANSEAVCRKLLQARRVDFYAPADYSANRRLERRVKLVLDMMIARILYKKEIFAGKLD